MKETAWRTGSCLLAGQQFWLMRRKPAGNCQSYIVLYNFQGLGHILSNRPLGSIAGSRIKVPDRTDSAFGAARGLEYDTGI